MMDPVYIRSAVAISPQHSFNTESFLDRICHNTDGKLYVADIDYSEYINPVAIRRMSRMLKMSISAGMQSLREAGITTPDAIITGTGRGSMNDTERFLTDMIRLEEEALNPTHFIQSTYNSPNGWLAMQTGSTGYNQTYVHRGISFELALLDARMLLQDQEDERNVLTGCYDEMTDDYFIVKDKVGYWKKHIPDSLELLQQGHTQGTIGGEGAAFFTLSNAPRGALCTLVASEIIHDAGDVSAEARLVSMLDANGLGMDDIDTVVAGMNGDVRQQSLYDAIFKKTADHTNIICFKHLTGEYDTSGGFALWLAAEMMKRKQIPEVLYYKKVSEPAFKHVLIVNHYLLGSASLLLLRQ